MHWQRSIRAQMSGAPRKHKRAPNNCSCTRINFTGTRRRVSHMRAHTNTWNALLLVFFVLLLLLLYFCWSTAVSHFRIQSHAAICPSDDIESIESRIVSAIDIQIGALNSRHRHNAHNYARFNWSTEGFFPPVLRTANLTNSMEYCHTFTKCWAGWSAIYFDPGKMTIRTSLSSKTSINGFFPSKSGRNDTEWQRLLRLSLDCLWFRLISGSPQTCATTGSDGLVRFGGKMPNCW